MKRMNSESIAERPSFVNGFAWDVFYEWGLIVCICTLFTRKILQSFSVFWGDKKTWDRGDKKTWVSCSRMRLGIYVNASSVHTAESFALIIYIDYLMTKCEMKTFQMNSELNLSKV